MLDYLTFSETLTVETVIARSRFIAYAYPAADVDAAEAALAQLAKEHTFATHICYAYRTLTAAKFSDDGEPQNTAGRPIFEVIRNNDLHNVLIAVVRYFGGVKLGTGGLTRAYSSAAASVVTPANTTLMRYARVFSCVLSYPQFNALSRFLAADPNCKILKSDFQNTVTLTFAAASATAPSTVAAISELLQHPLPLTESDSIFVPLKN